MSYLILFHNPSCSKSRAALELLEQHGKPFETHLYLKTPPDRKALEQIIQSVGGDPARLVRDDAFFQSLGISRDALQDSEVVISLLLEHPRLLERPIVLHGSRGAIGRPLEDIQEIL